MDVKVSALTDTEQAWVQQQLAAATQFVADYNSHGVGSGLAGLDHAWASWLDRQIVDPQDPNAVINAVGIAFGQALVDALDGFDWVIASDDQGSDLAVSGPPDAATGSARQLADAGEVLVYPANVVAKRYESRTPVFLAALHADMVRDIQQLR